jgi:hypothetical protein
MTVQPEEHWVSHQCHGNAYCVTWQMSRLPSIAHPQLMNFLSRFPETQKLAKTGENPEIILPNCWCRIGFGHLVLDTVYIGSVYHLNPFYNVPFA